MILLENLMLFSVLYYCSLLSIVFHKKYLVAAIYLFTPLPLYILFIFGLYYNISFYVLLLLSILFFIGLSLLFNFGINRQAIKKNNSILKMHFLLMLSFLLPGIGHFILNMKKTGCVLILCAILYFININDSLAFSMTFLLIRVFASIYCWMYLLDERKVKFHKICLYCVSYLSLMFAFGYLNLFVSQNFIKISIIKSDSMSPTIKTNDVIITKRINSNHQLKNSEIILFELPDRFSRPEDDLAVKRIIGSEGDSIRYDGLELYVNEQLILTKDQQPENLRNLDKVLIRTLSKDNYFVIGDNYSDSFDSRFFGPIPDSSIYGKVIQKIWPLNEVYIFKNIQE